MQELLTGIYSRYSGASGASLRAALTGGLHLEQAPQGTALPYATYQIITGRPEFMLQETHEMVSVQFDIYAATNASRQTLYGLLTALYDDSRPSVSGYTCHIVERTFQQPLRDGEQSEVFRYIVEYRVHLEKN
jgi:hypothetical protein